jgi:hypothetical protein
VAATEPSSSSASPADKQLNLAEVVGIIRSPFLDFKASDQSHTASLTEFKCSWTCDGSNIYYASTSELEKFVIPKHPNEKIYLVESEKSDFGEKFSICYLQDRLLARIPSQKETPLKVYNR